MILKSLIGKRIRKVIDQRETLHRFVIVVDNIEQLVFHSEPVDNGKFLLSVSFL